MSTCHAPFVSRIADTAYIASIEMHMPLEECIVIVLYLCVPRGPLGFGKGFQQLADQKVVPFQLCHQQHVAAEPHREDQFDQQNDITPMDFDVTNC